MMETTVLKRVDPMPSVEAAPKVEKDILDMDLTELLEIALDDVKNGRLYTVDPKNFREGFKELLDNRKREIADSKKL